MKITEGRLRLAASDVANFLACQQLTLLDLRAARGELRPPRQVDLGFEDLVRRGEEHERAVLARFRADGHEVADLRGTQDPAEATAEAVRGGVAVIYQATLTGDGLTGDGGRLFGRPDFLVRADLLAAPDGEGRPAGPHYEVVDAKLARTAKARAVLQAAFYSRLLAGLQGTEPRWMHLALGHGELAPFKVNDFAAYERQTRRRLEEILGAGPPDGLYPEPVEHCAICRWSEACAGKRRDDDDLSLVAGMTTGQRRADRLRHRTPGPLPRAARLPLQPLRAHVRRPSHRAARHPAGSGGPADGPVRHPRGRGGRPVPGQGVRRPVPGGAAGVAGGSGELLDQAARAVVRLPAAGRPAGSDGQPDRVRGGAGGRDGWW